MKSKILAVWALCFLVWSPMNLAQGNLLFDGDFESGTFQGWIPGGTNGGFASIAAKGSCFSSNDTTQISFNGNAASNYAALLRSNGNGDTGSIASLQSQAFVAGNGIIFSALSETLSSDPADHPVDLVINIRDSSNAIISTQPYRTAIIQLAEGCPSTKRDAAFSAHFIDTHTFAGQQISVEFTQHTNNSGLGYFTLIDNVIFVDAGEFVLSSGQPIAVAGTGVTSTGTFFLDPRASIDPDDGPIALNYSWFVNGENAVRETDVPCVNLNSDFELSNGNATATLFVNDGFNYSADTIRFVVPSGSETTSTTDSTTTTDTSTTTTTDTSTSTTSTTTGSTTSQLLTDPANECNVNINTFAGSDATINTASTATNAAPIVSIAASNAAQVLTVNYSIAGSPVDITNNISITDADADDNIISVTVSIESSSTGDQLTLVSPAGLTIVGSGGTSITLTQVDAENPVAASVFEAAVADIQYSYVVPTGTTADLSNRTITYVANDGTISSAQETSLIDVAL